MFGALFALVQSQMPELSNNFASELIIYTFQGHNTFNSSGNMWQSYDHDMARLDFTRGITFENLYRYDLNTSYSTAEGHCEENTLYAAMTPYWYWISAAFKGHECHSTYFHTVGTSWDYKTPDGQIYTACIDNHNNSVPYWFQHSDGKGTATKYIFTTWNDTTPEPNVFDIPKQCA